MILVGCDCCKLCLWEDDSFEVLGEAGVLAWWVDVDDMKTGLVAMHGVEYDLKIGVMISLR